HEEKREAGTSFIGSTEDNPETGLPSVARAISINDRFIYYIMFKPATDKPQDAIWVPVAKAEWFWKVTAKQLDKKWGLLQTKMQPTIEKRTVKFPIYESYAGENEWQEASPAFSHEQIAGQDVAVQELERGTREETFGPEEEFAPAWKTESPGYESGKGPDAYDMPGQETWPLPALERSLFERQVNSRGGSAPWAAGIDPFPATPTVAFHVNDPDMLAAFAPVTTSTVNHLCAALVDLTGNPATPPYAGLNDEEMVFAGSMLKICAMYAAFALRSQVQAFVDAAAANGAPVVPPGITDEIEKAWKPALQAKFPRFPAQSFGNKQDITFPKLDKIFTFLPNGKVDFARSAPAMTNAALDRAGEFGVPKGRFHDWMRLMLRWSNNTAASYCILALGYFYINGALDQAGFFDSTTGNGLWLSADYAKHDWVRTLAEKNANAAGQPLTPRWATAQRRRQSNITATAAQTARFMTLMAQDKLVDATASQEMRTLMQAAIECVTPAKCGIGSYVKDALDRAGRGFTALAAKKGFGDDSFSHECAIVERTVDGKHLRYVVVGLGSARSRKRRDLSELFIRLDNAIAMRNR
ncbi:MAG: serine hydrolase, partial [Desulfobacterales bacterium]